MITDPDLARELIEAFPMDHPAWHLDGVVLKSTITGACMGGPNILDPWLRAIPNERLTMHYEGDGIDRTFMGVRTEFEIGGDSIGAFVAADFTWPRLQKR